ncbi:MAG: methylated-DNA--[protein]-cysteine S-methyltransferase, partial [Caldilineaceae bacterium]|nr:methylated-DNA--[protein]-cysteine S-methyltransferase [Caldilineaceae bacterium]
TAGHAKRLLATDHSVLDATYDSGLSSPSRLHDLLVATEAMTPGEYKQRGAGMQITYGRHTTPFGDALIAVTERGICALSFIDDESEERNWTSTVAELRQRWLAATLHEDPGVTAAYATTIFAQENGGRAMPLQLLLKGTNFQIKVWEALLRMPPGMLCTYGDLAARIGQPKAARAVGSAVGANGIAYIIPCHRVIRSSGLIGDYHWGRVRKKAMLGWEAAHLETA